MIRTGETIYDNPKEILGLALVEIGRKNPNVVFVSCDTSLGTGASAFKAEFPERHIEFGIQEQNAMTECAGLALAGKIPIIGGHVPFVSCKCVDQIRNDLCVTKANVKIVGRDFGWHFPALGPTHMVFEDVGILRTLPNLTIIAPSDGPEYRSALLAAVEINGPVYIRVSRLPARRISAPGNRLTIGKGNVLRRGKDVTIFTGSTMVSPCLEAADLLSVKGVDAEVVNLHTIKPIDRSLVIESSSRTKRVVTVEEHSLINGLGCAVAEVLVSSNPVKMRMLGMKDCFSIVGQTYEEMLDYYGLSGSKIAGSVNEFLDSF